MAEASSLSETSQPKVSKKVFLVLKEQNRLAQLIITALRESKTCWAEYSKNQDNIEKLQKSQLKVVNTLAKYKKTWKKCQVANSQDTDTFHMLRGIDHERNLVRRQFAQFLKKTHKSIEIIKKFNRNMDFYNESLFEFHEKVMSLENQDELTKMSVPTLGWVKKMPDPRTKTLLADWEQLQLVSKITYLYDELQQRVNPHKVLYIDVHSRDDFDK